MLAQFIRERTVSLIFLLTLECRLPEKRSDSLVDRIFNHIIRGTAGKAQIAMLDGMKSKRVVLHFGLSSHKTKLGTITSI